MESEVIEYIIADDHELFREGFCALLDRGGSHRCIGQAKDGAALLRLAETLRPRVVILDFRMPVMDGIETLKKLRSRSSDLPVLMLTVDHHPYLMYRMLKAGTNGILLKGEATVDETKRALAELSGKGFFFNEHFNPKIIARVLAEERKGKGFPKTFEQLTPREVTVLECICEGYTSAEIGNLIHASPRTIDRTRISLFNKTKTTHLGALVIFALQAGIYDPERGVRK